MFFVCTYSTSIIRLHFRQIELDEFEDISFLSATLAWDDYLMCTFSEAVHTFESSFDQVVNLENNLNIIFHVHS